MVFATNLLRECISYTASKHTAISICVHNECPETSLVFREQNGERAARILSSSGNKWIKGWLLSRAPLIYCMIYSNLIYSV